MAHTDTGSDLVHGRRLQRSLPGEDGLTYFLFVPTGSRRPGSVFVAVHGISRNATEHLDAFAPHAQAKGAILVAPLFDAERFPDFQRLGRHGRGDRADLTLQRILDDVERLTGVPTGKIFLYGHSGGAQFVHRYAMAYPNMVARYALSAAGWYTAPDLRLEYPRGVRASGDLPGISFDPNRFLRIPACVLVGEQDVVRDDSLNQSEFLDSLQGRTRLERAEWWVNAMTTAARWRGIETAFTLRVLPCCGHDFTDMAGPGAIGRAVFDFLFDVTGRG